jgi:hypothetical protein
MAGTATDLITTLDALFQLLIARDVPPVLARHQILAALQADKLKVDFQVRDGPAGHVHWQAWERVFTLAIQDGHLIVEPRCTLDHPWDAYSFTITNPPVVNELWPEPPRVHSLQASAFTHSGRFDYARPELQTRRKPSPKAWFEEAKKLYPRISDESYAEYAHRLYGYMQFAHAADAVAGLWEESTLLRRLKD